MAIASSFFCLIKLLQVPKYLGAQIMIPLLSQSIALLFLKRVVSYKLLHSPKGLAMKMILYAVQVFELSP